MRPRSRTLKAVHSAVLEDIVTPSGIYGRTTKISKDAGKKEKIFLDPLDKEIVDAKLEAFSHAYQKLTTHKVYFEYAKPTTFQKKKLEALQNKKKN
jgi:small subunit ribosomal protein S7e